VLISAGAAQHMINYAAEFGMTVSARAAVAAGSCGHPAAAANCIGQSG
jgi:hypothetical protein